MDDISNYSPDIQDVLYHLVKSSKDGFKFLTNFLQQEFLDKALSIIDKKRIVVLQGIPSGRIYYKIVGTDAVHNPDIICFDHYCPCKIFQGSLASNNTLYICHHILAGWIARSLGTLPVEKVPDRDLISLIQ